MAGKLIMLPFRVWLGSARLLTRAAGGAAGCAVSLAERTIGVASPDSAEPGWREEPLEETVSSVEVEHPAPAYPVTAIRPQHERSEPPIVQEPVHVSEEPELVREEAEPGAEDGAGAQLTVIEPWNGYARMNARDVIARARQASPAELATVRLYEARHRSRQTVLAAVDRQLKLATGPHRA
jgi:hypothetical protein